MQIITWKQFLKSGLSLNERLSSMTVGVFDGVHLGHQRLLNRIVSHNADFIPAVVTFKENHKIVRSEVEPAVRCGVRSDFAARTTSLDIQSFDKRIAVFEKLGIQIVIVVDFDEEFRRMPGLKFLEILLKHGSVGFFAVGSDFRCGYQLDTDAKAIQNFFASRGIAAEIVPEVCCQAGSSQESLPISSSRIRAAIAAGDVSSAKKMLGHDQLN